LRARASRSSPAHAQRERAKSLWRLRRAPSPESVVVNGLSGSGKPSCEAASVAAATAHAARSRPRAERRGAMLRREVVDKRGLRGRSGRTQRPDGGRSAAATAAGEVPFRARNPRARSGALA
jgi:hypothetical protein